jgi:hypothetical protein
MRGHEPIFAMRQQGHKPALVFLDMLKDNSPGQMWREWPEVQPAIPTVWVQDEDSIPRLDLRFLIGLPVVITGTDQSRVEALERAAIEAGAVRVVCNVVAFNPDAEVLSITDRSQHGSRHQA